VILRANKRASPAAGDAPDSSQSQSKSLSVSVDPAWMIAIIIVIIVIAVFHKGETVRAV
jgi:hypothetical protein